MLTAFWFDTSAGLGYGVTAHDLCEAKVLLSKHGYPPPDVSVTNVIVDIQHAELDQDHVVPNAGPMVVRGVWFPRHNV